jgi:hypothetical protein
LCHVKAHWEKECEKKIQKVKKLKSEVNVIVVKGLNNDSVAFIACGAKSNFENTLYVNGGAT